MLIFDEKSMKNQSISHVILLLTLLFFSLSCGTKKVKNQLHEPLPVSAMIIDFYTIQSGNLFGAGDEGIEQSAVLVNSESELETLITTMNSTNNAVTISELTLSYDLKEHSFLFIFDRVRGSGGHSISVSSLYQHADFLEVQAKTSHPEGPATTVMTQPFHIVAIHHKNLKSPRLVIVE